MRAGEGEHELRNDGMGHDSYHIVCCILSVCLYIICKTEITILVHCFYFDCFFFLGGGGGFFFFVDKFIRFFFIFFFKKN